MRIIQCRILNIASGFLNCHVALARGLKGRLLVGFSQILLFFGLDIPLVLSLFVKAA